MINSRDAVRFTADFSNCEVVCCPGWMMRTYISSHPHESCGNMINKTFLALKSNNIALST